MWTFADVVGFSRRPVMQCLMNVMVRHRMSDALW